MIVVAVADSFASSDEVGLLDAVVFFASEELASVMVLERSVELSIFEKPGTVNDCLVVVVFLIRLLPNPEP
jgi:hypothetical protein